MRVDFKEAWVADFAWLGREFLGSCGSRILRVHVAEKHDYWLFCVQGLRPTRRPQSRSGRLIGQWERYPFGVEIHIHLPEHRLLFPAILRCDQLFRRVLRQDQGDILHR